MNICQAVRPLWHGFGASLRHSGEDMLDVSNKVLAFFNRHNVVRQAGGDGASWHPVILGRCRVLYMTITALALDRPQPKGPSVRFPKARCKFLLFLVLGQRAEK